MARLATLGVPLAAVSIAMVSMGLGLGCVRARPPARIDPVEDSAEPTARVIAEADEGAPADVRINEFQYLLDTPSADPEGMRRYDLARELGALGSSDAVPVLLAALERPEGDQPKAVIKAVIDALGQIGDPAAVDALIAVQFRIADAPGTQSVGERAVCALAAIGEPAVPRLVATVQGENTRVNQLAADRGVDGWIVSMIAVRILGVVGSDSATTALIDGMPRAACRAKAGANLDPMDVRMRPSFANALGSIGDPRAVAPLCECRDASHDPGDLWGIASALGRIGGGEAFACLDQIVRTGEYDPDTLVISDMKHQIRWEAVRWQILAAPPAEAKQIRATIKASDRKVRDEIAALGWAAGVAVLETCAEDVGCYEAIMLDGAKTWFEREVAVFNVVRLSTPGDVAAAAKVARSFELRDPEARTNVAILTARLAGDRACPDCARALEDVMKAEELTKDPTMQMAWIAARQTIAKLSSKARE